jgi:hypothetical protein
MQRHKASNACRSVGQDNRWSRAVRDTRKRHSALGKLLVRKSKPENGMTCRARLQVSPSKETWHVG